jgi:formylglycine-generating enzyme required for sulfatase activity
MWAGSLNPASFLLRCRRSAAVALAIFAATVFWPTHARVETQQPSTRAGGAVMEKEQQEKEENTQRIAIREKLRPKHSFALVLGIDTFDDGAWPRLPGVLKEIQEIKAAFESHEFDVETNLRRKDGQDYLESLNAKELNVKIGNFLRDRGHNAGDRLIVYIATHGHAAPKDADGRSEGHGYLVTKDSPAPGAKDFDSRAYSVTKLAAALVDVEAQHIYFFFNACFSGTMVPTTREKEKIERVLQDIDDNVVDRAQTLLAHNARLILTAGSDDQTVPDVNNPFSKAVIDGLAGAADQDGDGLILGSELAHYVRERVAFETREKKHPNDPVIAFVAKEREPITPRSDLKTGRLIVYKQQGDFVFLSPRGRRHEVSQNQKFAELQKSLPRTQSIDCPDCPLMIKIADEKKVADEKKAAVQPFALAQTEATFTQWDACYRDFACHTWIDDHGLGRGDRPVSGLTWVDALEFISWLNDQKAKVQCEKYRFPTPEEWAFAARGNATTKYPWGDDVEPDQANCWNCGSAWDRNGPAPVGRFRANVFGLYDMVGNLWEWVESPENRCAEEDMLKNGRCQIDGSVIGGAFSTKLENIDLSPKGIGSVPRTSNAKHHAYRLETVGLRVACTLQSRKSASTSN